MGALNTREIDTSTRAGEIVQTTLDLVDTVGGATISGISTAVNTATGVINSIFAPTIQSRYQLTAPKVLYDTLTDERQVAPKSPIANNFQPIRIPALNTNNFMIAPKVLWSSCRCLNPDGTINKNAYLYNNKCIRCSNTKDVFYAKGTVLTGYTWSQEKRNTYISVYDTNQNIQQMPQISQYREFTNIADAKKLCESIPNCKGITRTYDSTGAAYYALRAGTIGQPSTTGESSWERSPAPTASPAVTVGKRKNTAYSVCDIPRAFADDIKAPSSITSAPTFQLFTSSPEDLINSFTASAVEAASAWDTFIENAQNTGKYYQLIGVERKLQGNVVRTSTGTIDRAQCGNPVADSGICVGPCDGKRTLHDNIQMLYDTNSGIYTLYGTTCHDATQNIVDRPSIPAAYTPQLTPDCAVNYDRSDSGSISKCIQQCDSSSTDNGSSCLGMSKPRESVPPQSYSCPPGLVLSETVCLHPCEGNHIVDGDYCMPPVNILPLPESINCIKTTATKWLCESEYDQYMLLLGPS